MTNQQQEKQMFGNISLSKKVFGALAAMGFEEPSPIQSQTIPQVLAGCDLIGQAQTGTGKTAAFGIPIVEKLNSEKKYVQALILTPTRELAIQVSEEISKIGALKRIRAVPVYGGQPIDRQIRAIKAGAQVVIATPGRLLDHIRRRTINFSHLTMAVLDESDEMMDMGFIDDVGEILGALPQPRQTLLFSATMPREILELANKFMDNPVTVAISRERVTVPSIEQYYYELNDKTEGLCRVLDTEDTGKTIIFSRTKKGADELAMALKMRGYAAEALHGDLSQSQRDRVMKNFRSGKLEILVATDVAARGIDVDDITHVFNYDIPQDQESYVHRIGRTGRAGRKGIAITFITPKEFKQLKLIERFVKTRIFRRALPTPADALERQNDFLKQQLRRAIELGFADIYSEIAAELAQDFDPVQLAAAALKLSYEGFAAPEQKQREEEGHDFSNTGARAGMVRLFINIGRAQNIRSEDLVKRIAEEADIKGADIGMIRIYDKFTFVEVPQEVGERVWSVMHRNTVKGYKINVEPARARQ